MKPLLFIILFCLSISNVWAEEQKIWAFKVSYDGNAIGKQTFTLSPQNKGYEMVIEANFNVQIFFIDVYNYKHKNIEIWQNDCLVSLNAKTNDNGDLSYVRLLTIGDTSYVKTADTDLNIFGCTKSFAYWDSTFLEEKALLNSQTGKLDPITATSLETSTIKYAGKNIPSEHYQVSTPNFTLELWYAVSDGEWLALQSTSSDGKVLQYERI